MRARKWFALKIAYDGAEDLPEVLKTGVDCSNGGLFSLVADREKPPVIEGVPVGSPRTAPQVALVLASASAGIGPNQNWPVRYGEGETSAPSEVGAPSRGRGRR